MSTSQNGGERDKPSTGGQYTICVRMGKDLADRFERAVSLHECSRAALARMAIRYFLEQENH